MSPDPAQVKAITFDLGNVLLPYNPFKVFSNLKRASGCSWFKIFFYFLRTRIWQHFERGALTREEFYQRVNQDLSLNLSQDVFCDEFGDIFTENPEIIKLLPKLKKSFKLFLLSNTNPIHYEYCLNKYSFFEHFDKMILSYDVKVEKPSRKIFEILLEMGGILPHETVFIDDRPENVIGARRLGIPAIRFKNQKDFLEQFTQLGFLR